MAKDAYRIRTLRTQLQEKRKELNQMVVDYMHSHPHFSYRQAATILKMDVAQLHRICVRNQIIRPLEPKE